MKKLTQEEFDLIVSLHKAYCEDPDTGKKAHFLNRDLSNLDCYKMDLCGIHFKNCILSNCNFSYSNLTYCHFIACTFNNSNLECANFCYAYIDTAIDFSNCNQYGTKWIERPNFIR